MFSVRKINNILFNFNLKLCIGIIIMVNGKPTCYLKLMHFSVIDRLLHADDPVAIPNLGRDKEERLNENES